MTLGITNSFLGAVSFRGREELGGMVLLTPTSIAYTGTSASIGANGTVDFTGVTSVSLNGVFDATYDNYYISVAQNQTANYPVFIRMRASGTDSTSANYRNQYLFGANTSLSADRPAASVYGEFTYGGGAWNGSIGQIYGPYLSQYTAFRSAGAYDRSVGGGLSFTERVWTHAQAVSYDGFSLVYTSSGNTISGSVSVYGMVGA